MILFQIRRTNLPTRSAAGRQGRIYAAAYVASVVLAACMLSACASRPQSGPVASAAALYPDLNDPPPNVAVRADDMAQLKARLVQLRDDQERAATEQHALHQAGDIEPSAPIDDEPLESAVFTFRR